MDATGMEGSLGATAVTFAGPTGNPNKSATGTPGGLSTWLTTGWPGVGNEAVG